MASVAKRGKSWRARLRTPDGEWVTSTHPRRVDADQWVAAQTADMGRGAWVNPRAGRETVGTYAQRWLDGKPSLRPLTREDYQRLIDKWICPTFGKTPVGRVTPSSVRSWHARLLAAAGPARSAKAYRLLRSIFNTAAGDGLIVRNPCQIRGAGEERAAERPLVTAEQLVALLEASGPQLRPIVALAAGCGLRLGEILGLHVEDVDVQARVVHVRRAQAELNDGTVIFGDPKTAAGRRDVAMPAFVATEFKRLSTDGDRLFPYRRKKVYGWWKDARAAVGLEKLRLHDLRHMSATMAAQAGATTKELMSRLGHANPRAALMYQHAAVERDRELADRIGALALGENGSQRRVTISRPSGGRNGVRRESAARKKGR